MSLELHQHDTSDNGWEKLKPHTIEERSIRGGNAKNTRQVINGLFWIYAQELPGETCQQNMVVGKIFIADFVAEKTRKFRETFQRHW